MPESRVVHFRAEHPPGLIVEGFPGYREAIEALWERSEEFREVCADFLTARISLERAEQSEHGIHIVERYEELTEELRLELLALITVPPRDAS